MCVFFGGQEDLMKVLSDNGKFAQFKGLLQVAALLVPRLGKPLKCRGGMC